MDVKQARKRPILVDYMELTQDNGSEVAAWCGGEWRPEAGEVLVPTIHGQVRAKPTDRVMRGTQDFYPIRADVYAQGYADRGGLGMQLSLNGAGDATVTCDCRSAFASYSIQKAVAAWAIHAIEAHRGEL